VSPGVLAASRSVSMAATATRPRALTSPNARRRRASMS
jgi:hypothetical protein